MVSGPGANLLLHFHSHGLEVETHLLQNVHRHALPQLDQSEQQMLGADVIMVEAVGFLAGKRQDLLGAWGEIIHCSMAGRRAIARLPRHLTNIRFGEEFQTLANNLRAQMVAFLRVQLLLRAFLQMRRLRVDEKVHRWASAGLPETSRDRHRALMIDNKLSASFELMACA